MKIYFTKCNVTICVIHECKFIRSGRKPCKAMCDHANVSSYVLVENIRLIFRTSFQH